MNKKVLIIGRGYLGKEFERHGFETWGKEEFTIDPLTRASATKYDINDILKYDVIINCIGKSNTRWCEDRENFKTAMFSNGEIPKMLSTFCRVNNKKFIHISTGCLYDNPNIIHDESSFTAAHCNYTVTKWVGEMGCDLNRDIILRPRLYFSDIKDNNNLLCKLDKFQAFIGNVQDSITCTSTIVGASRALIEEDVHGIFNVAQDGHASISQIANWCGINISEIITDEELRARESLYLVNNKMDITKLKKYFIPTDIKTSVELTFSQLHESK